MCVSQPLGEWVGPCAELRSLGSCWDATCVSRGLQCRRVRSKVTLVCENHGGHWRHPRPPCTGSRDLWSLWVLLQIIHFIISGPSELLSSILAWHCCLPATLC